MSKHPPRLNLGLALAGCLCLMAPGAGGAYEPQTFAFYFPHGSAVMYEEYLQRTPNVAQLWQICHAETFVLTGYHGDATDEGGNAGLALARAKAVAEAVIRLGVPADRVVVQTGDANTADAPFSSSDPEELKRRVVLSYEFKGENSEYGCQTGTNLPG